MTSATWPSGRLRAAAEQVSLSAPLLGAFVVTLENVVSIERFDFIPLLGRGLRFVVRESENAAVVFWTYRHNKIIETLALLGWTVIDRRR